MPATPVSVERLRELQEEARLLVARWGLRTAESASLGRYLVAGFRIPAGELAMLLPPNRILAFSEVTQFNTVIQVRHSAVLAERLYSASLTGDDLDNFLSHACDPACGLVVDADLAVRLRARRDVPPGEPLSIDYEALEEDMLQQGVQFDCACGAASCRGLIVGSRARAERRTAG